MSRSVNINYGSNPVSDWTWSGNSAQPWRFISATDAKSMTAADLAQGVLYGYVGTTSDGALAGYLTTGNSTSLPVFQETITGAYSYGGAGYIAYHGCGGSIGSGCHYNFL